MSNEYDDPFAETPYPFFRVGQWQEHEFEETVSTNEREVRECVLTMAWYKTQNATYASFRGTSLKDCRLRAFDKLFKPGSYYAHKQTS